MIVRQAPELQISHWLNTDAPITLESLRGRVVVIEAFQMLCPGCVAHGIPQAQRIAASFASRDVAVIGLHTVFEHHEAMQPVSLAAFLHEFGVSFPVGVDRAREGSPIPETMQRYELRGTPSLVLIDPVGRIRLHAFGRPDDMSVGAAIAELALERVETPTCSADGCTI